MNDMANQESKINYCTKDGECICAEFTEEKNCAHYIGSESSGGGCIMRYWFSDCMSPTAREAAKKAAISARKAIDAATTDCHFDPHLWGQDQREKP